MKKLIITALFIIATLLIGNNIVQASQSKIELVKKDEILDGYNTMTVKINSSEEIGVISGFIKYDENIENMDVPSSYNGWMITYNVETGKFNAFNPAGSKQGDIILIKYKIKDLSKEAKIMLTDIEETTISYDTIEIEEKIEEIANKEENKDSLDKDKNPSEGENSSDKNDKPTEDENSSDKNDKPTEDESSSDKNNKPTEGAPDSNKTTATIDKTMTNEKIPNAGITRFCKIAILILAIISVTTIMIYNKFYRDVR